jgi:hypothetical protein
LRQPASHARVSIFATFTLLPPITAAVLGEAYTNFSAIRTSC